MASLSDPVSFINDFIAKRSDDINQAISGSSNRLKASPQGQLDKGTLDRVQTPSFDQIKSNPIINMGIDSANQAVTTITQQLIQTGAKRLDATVNKALGIPVRKTLQDVTDGYFMAVALASTAKVEVLMELARANARLLITTLKQKNQVIADIRKDIVALHNAVMILMNSQPFFTDYYNKLVQAYQDILQADKDLKSVVSVLGSIHRYRADLYAQSLVLLESARDLILPDRTAQVNEINSGNFLQNVFLRKTNKDALAAALTIPAITARIGENFLKYVGLTAAANELVSLFESALSDFINQYKRNDNIDQTTINHINAGIKQIDSLLGDMNVVLFPTDGREKKPAYPGQVSTSATGWGMRLTTVIEWLKIQPGKASAELDITGESIRRYNQAIQSLLAMGNRKKGLAILTVNQAREDVKDTVVHAGKILLMANTLVVTQNSSADVQAKFMQLDDYFSLALGLDNDIIGAVQPFVDTPFELLNGADKIVGQLFKITQDLGLDRAADLLQKCDIKNFWAMNASTATYAGAAVVGVGSILGVLKSSPDTTDAQTQKLQAVSDDFNRQNQVKQVEATRSASTSDDAFVAQEQQTLQTEQQKANAAIEVAKQQDPEVSSAPDSKFRQYLSTALGKKMDYGTN